MNWGTGGWAAILCGLLALQSARAQAVKLPQAQLGLPAEADASDTATQAKESSSKRLPAAPLVQIEPLMEPSPDAVQNDVGEKGIGKKDTGKKEPAEKAPAEKDPFLGLDRLPEASELFALSSEAQLFERIRLDRREDAPLFRMPNIPDYRPARIAAPRIWPTLAVLAEPNYLCYRRLLFEQRAFERYGWDLGVIQPPISAAIFYADLMLLPLYFAADPCRDFECNTGLCLPGDPTPLMWHRRIK